MPRVSTDTGARVLQRLELEPLGGHSDAAPVGKKTFTVRRYQMGERPSLPHMSMEPEAAIHGVDHSFASRVELAKWRVLGHGTDIGRRLVIRHASFA